MPGVTSILYKRQLNQEAALWQTFVNLYVDTYTGEYVRLGDWVNTFVTHGLIPFMKSRGFILQNKMRTNLLYWLYAIEYGYQRLPSVKHRNLDKDRWIFESAVSDSRWDQLFTRWGVHGVFENSGYIREAFPEFVYVHLNPEDSDKIYGDDVKDFHAQEDDDIFRAEQESSGGRWDA